MHASILFLAAAATSVFAQTATPDACAAKCATAYNTCRGQPSANRATCAAEYSSCLGYLPFDNSGSLVTPTACSASATGSATAAPVPTGGAACAEKCAVEYNTCRSAPSANRATCASSYSACLGYLPFDNSGSLVTPTACSATGTGLVTATATVPAVIATATGSACLARCNAEYNACRVVPAGAPSANQSFCAAKYAGCLGYSPFGAGPSGTYVTPTACSAGATGSATGTGMMTMSPSASPTFMQANGASNVQGGIIGAAGLIAAAMMI